MKAGFYYRLTGAQMKAARRRVELALGAIGGAVR
jgi:hypothetical protein